MEDKAIISHIQEGDISSFEMAFKQYYKPLVNYSAGIVKNRDDAEDIVQQVFITVWQKRKELQEVAALRPYLYRAVYNSSLNRLQQQAVRNNYAKEVVLSTVPAVESPAQYKELQQRVDEAIAALPEQCGRIFKMSRFDQLRYQEIADKLGLSVKTVENQMGKALKLMRESLKEYIPLFVYFIHLYFD